jgi:ferredoxin-NADP reductase
LYIGVAAAITWYRFITPVRQAVGHRFTVESVTPEAHNVVSIVISGRHLDELQAQPGQFFRWRFLTRGLWWTSMPYSLSAPPRGDLMRITVKLAGDHSTAIRGLAPGTRVIAAGPYGTLTAARRRRHKVLLIAGGVGITPLRPLLETLPAAPGDLTLIYRVSSMRDVVFRRELEQLAARRKARVWFVAGTRDELDVNPLSGAELTKRVPGLIDHDVYLCGPPGLTSAITRELLDAGVRRRHIHQESFEF